jgi:hypothetical protein
MKGKIMTTTIENKDAVHNTTPVCTARSDKPDTHVANQIESVKRQVFNEYKHALGDNQHLLRLALFEADVLARQTGFPELVFPALAVEKARNAARWQVRQQYLLRSNSAFALSA